MFGCVAKPGSELYSDAHGSQVLGLRTHFILSAVGPSVRRSNLKDNLSLVCQKVLLSLSLGCIVALPFVGGNQMGVNGSSEGSVKEPPHQRGLSFPQPTSTLCCDFDSVLRVVNTPVLSLSR